MGVPQIIQSWMTDMGIPFSETSTYIYIYMLYIQYNQQFLGKMTMRMHWERKDIHAQNRTFARSLCFLARNSPSKTTDPQEVCAGLLPQMVVKRTMKQILCRTHGEGPQLVYIQSIPARRLEPWMKHVLKPLENEIYYVIIGER